MTYRGVTDPGSSSSSVFASTQVGQVKVPFKYKNTTFCGKNVTKINPTMQRKRRQERHNTIFL